jgi:integrase
MKLTATTLRSLALPHGLRERTFFDDELAGFGVRIRAGGSRTWIVQYKIGDKHRRLTLGPVNALDPGKARATAKDILAAVRLGKDPAAEKAEQREKLAETFGALLPRFLARQRQRLKPRSYEEVERHLLAHAKSLHSHAVESIDRRTIAIRLAEIAEQNGPSAANRVRASLSAYFMWLAREGIIESNPVAFTNKAVEGGARDRVLQDTELAAIWRAAGDDHYGIIVKLLILIGARRDEIGGLRWSEINLDDAAITLPGERTKNRREHVIPLSDAALAILQAQPRRLQPDGDPRDLVFGHGDRGWQDWSGSKSDLDARIQNPIADWRLHDFRRTLSTTLHDRLGVLPHIVEAILGHVDGHRAGVAGVYNKALYLDERRRALAKWADHVEALVTGKRAATVVKLRARK